MPTPPPPEETRWKQGQSGNPDGYSRGRRITDRLIKIIEDKNLGDTIAVAWLGAALGDEKLLKGRKPNAAFFSMLLERIEGRVPQDKDEPEVDAATGVIQQIKDAIGKSGTD